jgi:signal transduction histidine kinase
MRAAEAERRHWARELHDETLQGLGGLRMLLTAASRSNDPELLRQGVADAVQRLEEEIDGLRGLVRELRPAALDELGPAAAIEGLTTRVSDRNDVEVSADVRLAAKRYGPDVETAIYRIVQEAVNNAVRHSGAEHVRVTVEGDLDIVHVCVSDDGSGFDPTAPDDGFGLTGMRERVALLRGDLEICSSSEGTTITAAIPTRSHAA